MKMARVEAAARTVLAFHQALNRRDLTGMLRLISDDCHFESAAPPPDGTSYAGKEAIRGFWEECLRQFPTGRLEVEEMIGFGNQCVVRWIYEWTNAAGEKRHLRGVDLVRVRNGLICEQRSYAKTS